MIIILLLIRSMMVGVNVSAHKVFDRMSFNVNAIMWSSCKEFDTYRHFEVIIQHNSFFFVHYHIILLEAQW